MEQMRCLKLQQLGTTRDLIPPYTECQLIIAMENQGRKDLGSISSENESVTISLS